MGDRIDHDYNADVTKIQHTNYVRNSRAITVLWFIFSACVTILTVIVFIQPFWVGDTVESPGVGYFGLYEFCEKIQSPDYTCTGSFLDFNTIGNDYFRASSFLVGISALLFIFSVICMLLFLFVKPATVLRICGWLQLLAGLAVTVACIIFPNSWDDLNVKRICGQDSQAYNMAKCEIKWGYILAIVLIFDDLILAVLAFVLAAKQAKLIPEKKAGYVYDWRERGHINHAYTSNHEMIMTTQKSSQQQFPYDPVTLDDPLVSNDNLNDDQSLPSTRSDPSESRNQSKQQSEDFRL